VGQPATDDQHAQALGSAARPGDSTAVIMLIDDLNIRVIATDTGEQPRSLQLDPTRGYQPRFET